MTRSIQSYIVNAALIAVALCVALVAFTPLPLLAQAAASNPVAAVAATAGVTLATKILSVATAVYGLLELLKKLVPGISGQYALALNVGLSVLGAVIAQPADQLLSVGTLLAVIATVGVAAGYHGTVSKLKPAKAADDASDTSTNA